MTDEKPRRFYKTANVAPADGGFAVALDGRIAKTPAGRPLAAPTHRLADLLAAEWEAQASVIDMNAMPLTRMAFTAIDRTAERAPETAKEVARYADADVLCYFAEEPQLLLEAEVAHWLPVLDWARDALGLEMTRAHGIAHRPQPPRTLARVEALALELEPFALTGLVFCAALFGSAVLALAVQRRQLHGEAAFELSRLDEALQVQRWGEDAEAAARTAGLRAEAQMAGRWFEALRA
jgi:chaperone required for assembly of F1-ATPase